MKFPNHIMLDISKPVLSHSNQYWILKYIFFSNQNKSNINTNNNLSLHKRFIFKKENLFLNKLINNQKCFTIKYNFSNPTAFLSNTEQNFYKQIYAPRVKVKHKISESKIFGKKVYDFMLNSDKKFDEKTLKRLVKNFSLKTTANLFKSNNLWSLFDINFLRKERIYTKLKYSRVPQYDIVSGGAAALFAGFLGFLFTEKFGFELVDSGDFYFLFMYIVFLLFFCRMFLKIMNHDQTSWNVLSLKWLISFYKILSILFIKFFSSIFNNIK